MNRFGEPTAGVACSVFKFGASASTFDIVATEFASGKSIFSAVASGFTDGYSRHTSRLVAGTSALAEFASRFGTLFTRWAEPAASCSEEVFTGLVIVAGALKFGREGGTSIWDLKNQLLPP